MEHRQTPYLKFICNSHLQDELKFITQCTRIACFSIQNVEIPLIQSTEMKKRMEQLCSKHDVNNSALLFHIFHIYIIRHSILALARKHQTTSKAVELAFLFRLLHIYTMGRGHEPTTLQFTVKQRSNHQPVRLVLIRSYTIVDYYCWLVWCERKILFWLEIYDRLRPSEHA